MDNVTTIGLDIAKTVFQVHGVDAVGAVVIRRKLPVGGSSGSSRRCPDVSWGSRHAAPRTIRREN
jgi:hypothetical protein